MTEARIGVLRASAIGCALAILLASSSALAAGWGSGSGKASPRDFIPKNTGDEAYTARYSWSAKLDDGGSIGGKFTISNLGFGDEKAAAEVKIALPGQKPYKYKAEADKGDWSSKSNAFDLSIAGARVRSSSPSEVKLDFKDPSGKAKLEIVFANTLPMWKPGRGQIKLGEEGFFKYGILAPRATITGRAFVGGTWHDIKATRAGFFDHNASNVLPYKIGKRFVRMRDFKDDVTFAWREVQLEEEWGGQSITWVMVGYKDEIVFSDASGKASMRGIRRDSETGYGVPHKVSVRGSSGADTVEIAIRAKSRKRKDLLASYGSAARAVAGAFSKPYRYSLPASYSMKMKIGGAEAVVNGEGSYSADFINE